MLILLALVAALVGVIAASFGAGYLAGYHKGSPRVVDHHYFDPRPVTPHPDREIIAENVRLRERVADLEEAVRREARTYLELLADVAQLRQMVAHKEKLRERYLRLLRRERARLKKIHDGVLTFPRDAVALYSLTGRVVARFA